MKNDLINYSDIPIIIPTFNILLLPNGHIDLSIFNCKCTALVLWGYNLTSNVGYPKFDQVISNLITLSPYYYGIVVGLILSDASLRQGKSNWNVQLHLKQSSDPSDLWFVFNFFLICIVILPPPTPFPEGGDSRAGCAGKGVGGT